MRNNHEKWKKIIEQMRSSGISQRKWCEEHGINYSTMRGWARKINKLKAKNSETITTVKPQGNTGSWVKIEKPATKPQAQGGTFKKAEPIQIQITKISISVHNSHATALLKEILGVSFKPCKLIVLR